MTIKLSLKKNQFLALAELINMLSTAPYSKTQEQKMIKSAMKQIVIKIQKKQVEIVNANDLFNEKNKVKLSMEYFEAYYIDSFIGIVRANPNAFPVKFSDYQNNALLQISNELNQKMS